jgi:hypothetical protein
MYLLNLWSDYKSENGSTLLTLYKENRDKMKLLRITLHLFEFPKLVLISLGPVFSTFLLLSLVCLLVPSLLSPNSSP